jgi:hypothetical protein
MRVGTVASSCVDVAIVGNVEAGRGVCVNRVTARRAISIPDCGLVTQAKRAPPPTISPARRKEMTFGRAHVALGVQRCHLNRNGVSCEASSNTLIGNAERRT